MEAEFESSYLANSNLGLVTRLLQGIPHREGQIRERPRLMRISRLLVLYVQALDAG